MSKWMVDTCGTLIDITTRNTYDYVSDVCPILNQKEEEIERLKEEKEQLKTLNRAKDLQISGVFKELNYLQDSISNAIKHQKTELQQKTLQEIIEDYNEWMLGHKVENGE